MLSSGKCEPVTLDKIRVGDILKIKDGDSIPADCILLRTKKKANGMCFV
jgi:magnesium-transporting ATPase (P-type)